MARGAFSAIFILATCCATSLADDSRAHLVLVTQSKEFVHDVVKKQDGKPSRAEQTFNELATRSRLFDVEAIDDVTKLTPEKLKHTQIIVFYTTGDLPFTNDGFRAFDQWIKDGGGFLGIHCATDTLANHPMYPRLIGATFDGHPWNADATVTIKINDPDHPACRPFKDGWTHQEEIYQFKNFDPTSVRVLMSLDMEKTELKKPQHIPIAWCKEYGKGNVFYTSLGHRDDVWVNEPFQQHLIGAIEWLLGRAPGSAAPNPDVSKQEEEIAKKAATTAPAKPQVTSAPALPTVPDGFSIHTFVRAPDIHSPASIAATPDGKLFVGEDEYNSQEKREQGLSRIKLCVDTDGDGKADKITVFAEKINSPQGMTCVGGTLFVVHAPLLTALRDTDGDGIADQREDLIKGFGPAPEGLVQHVPSGIRMGIDGWLYISVGDKGIKDAVGKDGRHISLEGGGIVRVRPDGRELQVFCTGTRNIYDVAIDPLLNIFTRDNTNDGDGWNSRLSQMQRGGVYGYPSLFKNYAEEIIPCLADYGTGGATGSLFIHEPGFPGDFGDCLYTTDWARGIVYRHVLTPDGASFKVTQAEFIKNAFCTHEDIDGLGRIFIADWGRRDWGNNEAAGAVHVVKWDPKPTTQPATGPVTPALREFPNLGAASSEQLIEYLASPSAVLRREAQAELLLRGNTSSADAALKQMMGRSDLHLDARVAAMFTLAQLMGGPSSAMIADAGSRDPALREYALRALVDRDDFARSANPQLFLASLKDMNPRARVQAAIGIGRIGDPQLARNLLPLTSDKDAFVRNAAMQSIRALNDPACCTAALNGATPVETVRGALCALRTMQSAAVVDAMRRFIDGEKRTPLRRDAIKTLARLYKVEAPYDGGWWRTRPDTRGPYYKPVAWAGSAGVADIMLQLVRDGDPETQKLAIVEAGRCGMSEAAPALSRMIEKGDPLNREAAAALIEMKAASPDVLSALEKIAMSDKFDADVRGKAAAAMGAIDGPDARAALMKVIRKLDSASPVNAPLLEMGADALAGRAAAAGDVNDMVQLLSATQKATRAGAATSLLRSPDQPIKDRVAALWKSPQASMLEALLSGLARIPVDVAKPYLSQVREAMRAKDESVRHSALIALGYLDDANAVKELLAASARNEDRIAAATALATIEPGKAADNQVSVVAQLLVLTTGLLTRGNDHDAYAKVLSGAQRYAQDKRIPKEQAEKLLAQLKQTGAISSYLRTAALAAPDAKQSYSIVFPPEQNPAGPFGPFVVDGKTIDWKPISTNDPHGIARLDMPPDSVVYLTTTYDATMAGTALLTTGSDDGIHAWFNGKQVLAKDRDRSVKPDADRVTVQLQPGPNVLLIKVNNHGDGSGVQTRLRSHPQEFEVNELLEISDQLPTNPDKGKALFSSLGCVKCHTIDSREEPKGPFLGGVGSKYDQKYLAESILRPGATIAQGFGTTRIVAREETGRGATETIGFIVREGGEEIELRDLTGKVTIISKSRIAQRESVAGSMMPDGLVDALSLEDLRALLSYLASLKEMK